MDLQTTVQEAIVIRFRELFGDDFELNVPLSRYTSARIGGPAEMLVTARDAASLVMAAEMAYSQSIPYVVIGGGSNVLVSDAGISGLTIYNRARQTHYRHTGSRVVCTVESGMNLSLFARQCIGKGLGGLEWAVSVPGTVGGAVVGNSGAHGGDMSDNVVSVTVWKPGLGIRTFNNEDLKYGYRTSIFKEEIAIDKPRMVVLSAEIELKSESVAVLAARADGFTAHRKQTQPAGATMGSMFKNPENYYAGYLIDSAGLKGLQSGNAQISELHANFFVNNGDATAEEVRNLIAEAWHTVRDQFGVELELEVELVGNWHFEDEL
jgi:UDP-N-acetylmuramate dehydrogenase